MGTRLTERDNEIFSHIGTYRLTTREVLHKEFFDDSNVNAVTKVCSKLATNGYLNKHPLYGDGDSRIYYTLGIRALRHFGLPTSRGKPHGPQALISNFAFLGYCHFGSKPRRRLSVGEIKTINEGFLAKGIHANCYFLELGDERKTLGCFLADHAARPDHTVRKCLEAISKRRKVKQFEQLIDRGQFTLGVATSTQSRADALVTRLRSHQPIVPIAVEVVPDMLHVIERNTNVA